MDFMRFEIGKEKKMMRDAIFVSFTLLILNPILSERFFNSHPHPHTHLSGSATHLKSPYGVVVPISYLCLLFEKSIFESAIYIL
jgi:hypothetical protein